MNADLVAAITKAHAAGLCVLPSAADGTKRPDLPWKQFQTERPLAEDIAQWSTEPHDGIGYVMGAVSGNCEMLELEARAMEDADLVERFGSHPIVKKVMAGYVETTPSGGVHTLYRCDERVDGNLKLASRVNADGEIEVLIETRGEGGWTVAAPSGGRTHPSGGSWTLRGGDVETIVTITAAERAELLEFARSFDEMPVAAVSSDPPRKSESTYTPSAGDRPGDTINRMTWAEILEPHGWKVHHVDDEATYWTRPGKELREGGSATTGYKGNDVFHVFSTSTDFPTVGTMSKFATWSRLNGFRDDLSAAARSLTPERPPMPVAAILGDPGPSRVVDAPTTGLPDGWEEIDWPELRAEEHPAEDWLLEPFLLRGRGHCLYAPGKTGKSLLVLEAAAALATGRPFLLKPATEPVDVVYVDYEMTRGDVRDRLERMGYLHDDLSRLHYYPANGFEPLDTAQGGRDVLTVAKHHGAILVVIDTTAMAVEGEENEADTFRNLARCTFQVLKTAGVAAIRVDHAGKDLKKGPRGSSAKIADTDVTYQFTRAGADDLFALKTLGVQRVGYVPGVTLLRRSQKPLTHTIAEDAAEGTAAGRLAADLERIGVAVDVSQREARLQLDEWNLAHPSDQVRARTEVLALAIRMRQTSRAGGTAVSDIISDVSGESVIPNARESLSSERRDLA